MEKNEKTETKGVKIKKPVLILIIVAVVILAVASAVFTIYYYSQPSLKECSGADFTYINSVIHSEKRLPVISTDKESIAKLLLDCTVFDVLSIEPSSDTAEVVVHSPDFVSILREAAEQTVRNYPNATSEQLLTEANKLACEMLRKNAQPTIATTLTVPLKQEFFVTRLYPNDDFFDAITGNLSAAYTDAISELTKGN